MIWGVANLGALGCVDCYDVDDLEIWPGWHRLASVEITWKLVVYRSLDCSDKSSRAVPMEKIDTFHSSDI